MTRPAVDPHRVPWRMVLAYGAPGVGAGYMYLLLGLYVMKFSTDVLLIAPAAMGLIFAPRASGMPYRTRWWAICRTAPGAASGAGASG
jgi:hypothetical protein